MTMINKEAALADMDYYISAKKLIEDILEARGIEIETVPKLIRFIKAQPKVERKRGRWAIIKQGERFDFGGTKVWCVKKVCSECSFIVVQLSTENEFSYCPNCGARMENEE